MFTKKFWKATAERAVKTAAQAAALALGADAANLLHANALVLLGAFGGGALLSVLTSLGSLAVGEPDSPSAVAE